MTTKDAVDLLTRAGYTPDNHGYANDGRFVSLRKLVGNEEQNVICTSADDAARFLRASTLCKDIVEAAGRDMPKDMRVPSMSSSEAPMTDTTQPLKLSTRLRLDNAIKELDDIRAGNVEYDLPPTAYYVNNNRVFYLQRVACDVRPCDRCAFPNLSQECVTAPCCDGGYFRELGE